jgi:uncharacterized RDD family membrane protein YckC
MLCARCSTENDAAAQVCQSCGGPLTPAVPYAGFWLRFWAYLIDGLVLSALPLVIALLIAPLFFTGGTALAGLGVTIFLVPTLLGEGWLYFAILESSLQATPGKRVLGLKVTGIDGEPISFGRASLRYFAKILSAAILNIGFIMAAFTKRKQALHDILASCLVVRAGKSR